MSSFSIALERLQVVTGDELDEEIAEVIADYLVGDHRKGRINLFVHPLEARPLSYDWEYKGVGAFEANSSSTFTAIHGISTTDLERARQWCREALLKGYTVFRSYNRSASRHLGRGAAGHGRSIEMMRRAPCAREGEHSHNISGRSKL